MKFPIINLTFLILVLTSCGHQTKENNFATTLSNVSIGEPLFKESFFETDSILTKYYMITNEYGQTNGAYPFPSNWKYDNQPYSNIFIKNTDGSIFYKPTNKYYRFYKNSKEATEFGRKGYPTNSGEGLDSFIQDQIAAISDTTSYKLIRHYMAPEIATVASNIASRYIRSTALKNEFMASLVTEWDEQNGNQRIIVINYFVNESENTTLWGYSYQDFQSPVSSFDSTKQLFLNSIKNYQPCYESIFESNKRSINAVTNNHTQQYFPPKQKRQREENIRAEQKRTGTYEYDRYDEYLARLKERGIISAEDEHIINLVDAMYISSEESSSLLYDYDSYLLDESMEEYVYSEGSDTKYIIGKTDKNDPE